jgi:hypothetical protein
LNRFVYFRFERREFPDVEEGLARLPLVHADRLPDAYAYAEAARVNFQTLGDRAAQNIQDADRLIAKIDQAMVKKSDG